MKPIQFEAIGGDWIDPPMLLPASIPLELSGEGIRNRLITSSDGPGEELALRPDLTLAVVRHFIETGGKGPVSYRYFGRAFRQPASEGEPVEFDQTGFEILGDEDGRMSDVRTLSVICEEIAGVGIRDAQLYLGDISIFTDVLAALDLTEDWQSRLSRAFRRREGVQVLLNAETSEEKHSELAETLSLLPPDRSAILLEEVLAFSSGGVIGGRTSEEILDRLRRRAAARQNGALPEKARDVLNDLIGISGPPSVFLGKLKELDQQHGLGLDRVIARTSENFEAMDSRRVPFWSHANVSIQFGRRFDYYDGFVFELCHTAFSSKRPLAAGGRYDGLVSWLSGGKLSVPAVGGVVRPDRLSQALAVEAGENA